MITVAKMIEALQALPPEMPMLTFTEGCEFYDNAVVPMILEVVEDENEQFRDWNIADGESKIFKAVVV